MCLEWVLKKNLKSLIPKIINLVVLIRKLLYLVVEVVLYFVEKVLVGDEEEIFLNWKILVQVNCLFRSKFVVFEHIDEFKVEIGNIVDVGDFLLTFYKNLILIFFIFFSQFFKEFLQRE